VNLGLSGKVRWIKKADRGEIRDLLQEASAAVYPSLWENFPYACLEAMATGVPVIASRCGGVGEIITDGETGLLFEPFSQAGLAEALKRLSGDAALSDRLGGAGRARVLSLCDPGRAAEAAEKFYRGILDG
jgi:glycosyltransferase involved in cell wall biosynthesis